jgi:hypothetical protein
MAVWGIIEERYLPPFKPNWALALGKTDDKYSRTSDFMGGSIKEIWDLYNDERISETDKFILGTTFDKVIVLREDIPKLVKYMREFDGESSIGEQADIIENAYNNDDDLEAIGWNQTSVNGNPWESDETYVNDDGYEDYKPYNFLTGTKHWVLFHEETSE